MMTALCAPLYWCVHKIHSCQVIISTLHVRFARLPPLQGVHKAVWCQKFPGSAEGALLSMRCAPTGACCAMPLVQRRACDELLGATDIDGILK
eukprot:1236609-Amphidinium_carterae.1